MPPPETVTVAGMEPLNTRSTRMRKMPMPPPIGVSEVATPTKMTLARSVEVFSCGTSQEVANARGVTSSAVRASSREKTRRAIGTW